MADDEAGLSAYELERLANMRRNAAHLESLGLDAVRVPSARRLPAARSSSASRKRPEPLPPREGIRKSSRQRTLVTMYSDETPLPDTRRAADPRQPYEGPDEPPPDDEDEEVLRERAARALAERPAAEAGTSRGIALDVPAVLAKYLGEPIPGPPTKLSAVSAITGGRGARFSKYAGALEWRNAIVLWVNVGGKDYKNVFDTKGAKGAVSMSWYASPMFQEASPIVQRLIATGANADKGGGQGGGDAVLLFSRLPGEPYVFCGRLAYMSHVPRQRPVKFAWELRDAPEMRGRADFEALLSERK